MAREYFAAYHSYLKAVEPLNDAERGRLFTSCLSYSMTGVEPELAAWRKNWQIELLEEAINAASEAGAENRIGYIRSTLLDWKMRGIRTIAQWADEEARRDGMIR
jgi:DnaD/phage-associated family protein